MYQNENHLRIFEEPINQKLSDNTDRYWSDPNTSIKQQRKALIAQIAKEKRSVEISQKFIKLYEDELNKIMNKEIETVCNNDKSHTERQSENA